MKRSSLPSNAKLVLISIILVSILAGFASASTQFGVRETFEGTVAWDKPSSCTTLLTLNSTTAPIQGTSSARATPDNNYFCAKPTNGMGINTASHTVMMRLNMSVLSTTGSVAGYGGGSNGKGGLRFRTSNEIKCSDDTNAEVSTGYSLTANTIYTFVIKYNSTHYNGFIYDNAGTTLLGSCIQLLGTNDRQLTYGNIQYYDNGGILTVDNFCAWNGTTYNVDIYNECLYGTTTGSINTSTLNYSNSQSPTAWRTNTSTRIVTYNTTNQIIKFDTYANYSCAIGTTDVNYASMMYSSKDSASGTGASQTFGYSTSNDAGSIEFTASSSYSLTQIEMWLLKTGTPTNNVYAELWTANASGTPLVKLATSTNLINGASITGSVLPYNFTFNGSTTITSGSTYAIVVDTDGSVSSSNYYRFEYAGGTKKQYTWNAGAWTLYDNGNAHYVMYGLPTTSKFCDSTSSYSSHTCSYDNTLNFGQQSLYLSCNTGSTSTTSTSGALPIWVQSQSMYNFVDNSYSFRRNITSEPNSSSAFYINGSSVWQQNGSNMILVDPSFEEQQTIDSHYVDCSDSRYSLCDDFSTDKGYTGTYTIGSGKMTASGANSRVRINNTINTTDTSFCVEMHGYETYGGYAGAGRLSTADDGTGNTEYMMYAQTNWFIGNTGTNLGALATAKNFSYIFCYNTSGINPYLSYTYWKDKSYGATPDGSSTFNWAYTWEGANYFWLIYNGANAGDSVVLDYVLMWNGTKNDAPYLSYPADLYLYYNNATSYAVKRNSDNSTVASYNTNTTIASLKNTSVFPSSQELYFSFNNGSIIDDTGRHTVTLSTETIGNGYLGNGVIHDQVNEKWYTNTYDTPNLHTVSFWLNATSTATGYILVFGDATNGCDDMNILWITNKLRFGTGDQAQKIEIVPSLNIWHNYIFTSNSTTTILYVDGILNSTVTNTRCTNANVKSVFVGDLGNENHFTMDELQILNKFSTSSEISDIYNNQKSAFTNMLLGSEESPSGGGDTTAPTFTVIPANATLEYYYDSLSVDFNASESVTFAVNDTTNFAISVDGTLTNNTLLSIGSYVLNISITDTSSNYNSTLYYVDVTDTTVPTMTFTAILNGSNYNSANMPNFFINISTFDVSAIGNCSVGNTNWSYYAGNTTFFSFLNNTVVIDGNYIINVSCWDSSGNNASTLLDFVVDTITPAFTWYSSRNSMTNNPAYQVNFTVADTYLDAVNVTLICQNGTEAQNQFYGNINVSPQWATPIFNLSLCGYGNHTINGAGRDSLTHSPALETYKEIVVDSYEVKMIDDKMTKPLLERQVIDYSIFFEYVEVAPIVKDGDGKIVEDLGKEDSYELKDYFNNATDTEIIAMKESEKTDLASMNFVSTTVNDGEHMTTSWCIDTPKNPEDYLVAYYKANNNYTQFVKKDRDQIGHFTISDEKYYTHRKYWEEGFGVGYQSFMSDFVAVKITGDWASLAKDGRVCTNSGITGGLNRNEENSSVFFDNIAPTFSNYAITPTLLENVTGNVVIKINVTNPVDTLSQVYINWTTNYTINYSQYVTGVYNASPTYSRNMTLESTVGNISTYNVTIDFSLINPNIDYIYATPYNFTFNFTFYAIDSVGNSNTTKQQQKIQYDNDAPSSTSTISPTLGQDIIYSSGFTSDWYDANESDGHQILYNVELFKDGVSFRNVTNLTSSTYTTGSLEIGSWYYTVESCDNPNYLNYSNDTSLCASKIVSPTFELYTETPSSSGGGGGGLRTAYDYTVNAQECKLTISKNSIKINSVGDKINLTLINNEARKMDYEFVIVDTTGKGTIKEYVMFTKDYSYAYAGKDINMEISLDAQRVPSNVTITGGAILEIRPYQCKKIEIPIDVAIMADGEKFNVNEIKEFVDDYIINQIKENPAMAIIIGAGVLLAGAIGLMLL